MKHHKDSVVWDVCDFVALMQFDGEYKLLSDSYNSLDGQEESSDIPVHLDGFASTVRRRSTLRAILILQSIVIVVLSTALSWMFFQYSTVWSHSPQFHIYSPADTASRFEERIFIPDFHSGSIYLRPPSPEVDKAWNDLFNDVGASQIPKSQAQLLRNKTVPIPADPDHYIVVLSVFHQLHCLNNIRKALHPEYYIDPVTGDLDTTLKDDITNHVNHCLDTLRQGIMCASDLSPVVYQWNSRKNASLAHLDVVHTCRSFDSIKEWAKEHQLQHEFDNTVYVEGL